MNTDPASPTRVTRGKQETVNEKKRKSLQKDLNWNEAMLLNIFEESELPLYEGVEGQDPLNDEDYIGYFRITDAIEHNAFPRDELDINRKSVEWGTAVKPVTTTTNSLVSLRVPKFPETMTEDTLTRFVEELRLYRLNGGSWNRNMLADVDKSIIRRYCLGQQATQTYPLLKNWDDLNKVSDEVLFNSLASLIDSSGFHTSPFQQFLAATNTSKTIEYTALYPLNSLLAEREALMKKLNLTNLSKVEHAQLIKSFQSYVKLKGMSEDVTEKVKQIVAAALADKDVNYFKFVDTFYRMVEDCVNSLKVASQSYSPSLLAILFQGKSVTSVASTEVTDVDTHKPKKLKTDVNAVAEKPSAKMDSTKLQAKIQEQKCNWPKSGNCQFCGSTPHASCWYAPLTGKHAVFGNTESISWNKSNIGMAYFKLGYFTAKPFHPKGYDKKTKALTPDATVVNAKVPKGEEHLTYHTNELTNDMYKPRASVRLSQQRNKHTEDEVDALLDTGAQFNFISIKLAVLLKLKTYDIGLSEIFKDRNIASLTICGAVAKAKCFTATHATLLTIKHINKSMPIYEAEFIVGEFSEDLIIGLPTLRKQNILLWYREIFMTANYSETLELLTRSGPDQVGESVLSSMECSVAHDISNMRGVIAEDARKRVKFSGICQVDNDCVFADNPGCQTQPLETTSINNCICCDTSHAAPISKSEVGNCISKEERGQSLELDIREEESRVIGLIDESTTTTSDSLTEFVFSSTFSENYSKHVYAHEDIWEIPENLLEAVPTDLLVNSNVQRKEQDNSGESNIPTLIFGSQELQRRLRELLHKYSHVFSRVLSKEPAKVTPFRLTVDTEKWNKPQNSTPRRRYDITRTRIMQQMTRDLLDNGIIKRSRASRYSHAMIVPKSVPGTWRFVVDFKNLNKVTTNREQWPLPIIKEMFLRIGTMKAKIFNVLDCTSGYHQAPIDPECQELTAFMTSDGIYEWTRLPMGPTEACSYFQRVISTEVFDGLVTFICEQYLDDIINPNKNEDDCITNLTEILKRCEDKNLKLHPDKCRFGLSEVEYVGHLLNEHGVTFSRKKLDSVVDFPMPRTQEHMKSFLGLANYFREHIKHFSELTRPLHQLTLDYKKSKVLKWTLEATQSFEDIKKQIDLCPRLFFMDEFSEIFLLCDASDYGIGAYLYQLRKTLEHPEGIECPIAFISKSLDERMSKWDVPQKEGFSIFYAFSKLDYLLRDRRFTLKTDHENLTRLKENYGPNKKVQRWLLAFQHYDYVVEHIPGKLNIVADAFSRLCIRWQPLTIFSLSTEQTKAEHYKWFAEVHNDLLGHNGYDVTKARLKKQGKQWQDMNKDIRKYLKSCPCCQKQNYTRNNAVAFPYTVSSLKPGEKIQIDFITGLTPDDYGVTSILVVIDCMSRWVELYNLTSLSAETTVDCLLAYCSRFGVPKTINMDKDPVLKADIMTQLMHALGTNIVYNAAYSKEESAIVERANKEVLRHIGNFIFGRESRATLDTLL